MPYIIAGAIVLLIILIVGMGYKEARLIRLFSSLV